MRKALSCVAFGILVIAAVCSAQDSVNKDQNRNVTQVLERTVENMEHEFVPAAVSGIVKDMKPAGCPSLGQLPGGHQWSADIVASVN